MTTGTKQSVFAPDTATVRFDAPFNPDEFFQTRSGLWVADYFRRLVVAEAKVVPAGETFKVKPRTLGRGATDAEIEEELGGGSHLFEATPACAVIAGLITAQPAGEDGALLNSGYANLLYLRSCVVIVLRNSDRRQWRVGTWRRDGSWWDAGLQVFSPATVEVLPEPQAWGVFGSKPLRQPPVMWPSSATFSDIAIYFSLSIARNSKRHAEKISISLFS